MREEHLRYILEVIQAKSINKAAENLFLTHQSLARSLKTFELDLGVNIFKRTQKGVELTDTGKKLAKKIETVVSIFDEMREIAQGSNNYERIYQKTYTIYCSAYLKNPYVNIITQKMMELFQNVMFTTKTCSVNFKTLQDGFYLILSWNDALEDEIDKTQKMLWRISQTKVYLVVSSKHPLAKYTNVLTKNALRYPFVSLQLGEDTMNPFLEYVRMNQLKINVALETDHMPSYIEAIKSGDFIGTWIETALEMREIKDELTLKKILVADMPSLHIYGLISRESYSNNIDITKELLKILHQM